MRFLNWPHAIIGFLIGVALIFYIKGGSEEEVDVSVQSSPAAAEVQAE